MKLYIVATPIGNLSDVSERALETLRNVDAILCEDTRVTSKLLSAYGIKKPLESFHQHSDAKKISKVLDRLETEDLALVTDAGTPGISDPGGVLVVEAVKRFGEDITIVPIPGPSAVMAALSVSGFPADQFVFLGFPPHKKGRQKFFDQLNNINSTIVFYESTHRIEKTLAELESRLEDRQIMLGRELTKLHESIYRGTTAEVTTKLKSDSMKGEFVIVIAPV
ncbi:MAG: 16S rRNA (cytidine(1402)-2'-O)-methyltransferase [Candidatus Uhrbacteria bacterium]|nr:16S rRNA (cytidine(1402)-2'-O)-methyltransferase [Patescibacteria group bacterium]MBU1907211.1 16S rRNA (cytidine(1402)-2'-O)-methyltransferase [Patescibacteria group bacterium]